MKGQLIRLQRHLCTAAGVFARVVSPHSAPPNSQREITLLPASEPSTQMFRARSDTHTRDYIAYGGPNTLPTYPPMPRHLTMAMVMTHARSTLDLPRDNITLSCVVFLLDRDDTWLVLLPAHDGFSHQGSRKQVGEQERSTSRGGHDSPPVSGLLQVCPWGKRSSDLVSLSLCWFLNS